MSLQMSASPPVIFFEHLGFSIERLNASNVVVGQIEAIEWLHGVLTYIMAPVVVAS